MASVDNKPEEGKIVLDDSPEAARRITVEGWVSRHGRFWGDNERAARYDGSTHRRCVCGEITEKSWPLCEACRKKKSNEKLASLKRAKWDGVTPLCLFDSDRYFWVWEDVEEYCDEFEVEAKDLPFVICKPVKPAEFDPDDLFADELPDNGDGLDAVNIEVYDAVLSLNKAISKAGAFSWIEGDELAIIEGVNDR